MKLDYKKYLTRSWILKNCVMFCAIALMGFSLSFLIEVGWGTDPCTIMNLNLSALAGLSFGTWQLLLNLVLIIVTIVFGRNLIGTGTVCNMVFIGYIADFCRWLWARTGIHTWIADGGIQSRLPVFVCAMILFVIVAAVYMNSDMGLSPYDASALIISKYVTRIPFSVIRIAFDLSAVFIGVFSSKIAGRPVQGSLLGSVCMSLTLGPAIGFVGRFMRKNIPLFRQ